MDFTLPGQPTYMIIKPNFRPDHQAAAIMFRIDLIECMQRCEISSSGMLISLSVQRAQSLKVMLACDCQPWDHDPTDATHGVMGSRLV